MSVQEVEEVIDKFKDLERQDLGKAVKFLTQNPSISRAVLQCLKSHVSKVDIFQRLFEWLYKSVQLKSSSNELFYFCLQFIPELVEIYLYAVYEDQKTLKAITEALLIIILTEVEKGQSETLLQAPILTKSSVYHVCPSQLSQPLLTEAVLQRHNQVETLPIQPTFTGTAITVNNRFRFLCVVLGVFCDYIMVFSPDARIAFCHSSIRLSLQGMGTYGHRLDPFNDALPGSSQDLGSMRRISVSDGFITTLLRGIRICLFQSCHAVATLALQAAKLRSEYELLTDSIQISHTLTRLTENVHPQEFHLDVQKHSSYHGPGSPEFASGPADVHMSLNSQILQHNLSKAEHSAEGSTKRTLFSKSTAV